MTTGYQLVALDAQLIRPMGEVLESQILAVPLPAEAAAQVRSLNADKAAVRQKLAAIAAARTAAELPA